LRRHNGKAMCVKVQEAKWKTSPIWKWEIVNAHWTWRTKERARVEKERECGTCLNLQFYS